MPESQTDHDVIVIGAGIVGLATAYALVKSRPGISVAILEKESAVGLHQTGHNSGVIHSGLYYSPGSLKASLCVAGARDMYDFCVDNHIAHERCGKLVVARNEHELSRLGELERRGRANGVDGLRRLSAAEIASVEPAAVGKAALHAPGTGIVDYGEVAVVLVEKLNAAGVAIILGTEVESVTSSSGRAVVKHGGGVLRCRQVVACAGLWSDRVARRSGAPTDPRIVPFRGAYLRVTGPAVDLVNGMIYPVPDPELPFLGVHITRHISGGLLLGPTALLVASRNAYRPSRMGARDLAETIAWPGTWRVAKKFWRTGASEISMAVRTKRFLEACIEYMPALEGASVERAALAGVRAQAVGRNGTLLDDFVVSRLEHGIHVRNAPSPAATSSFALGRMIAEQINLPA